MMLASLSKPTREGRPKYLRQREAQKRREGEKKETRWRALRELLRMTEAPCL
jgi:hypothetical protein